MLRNIIIAALVALFTVGIATVIVADDGFPRSDQNPLTQVYKGSVDTMTGANSNVNVDKQNIEKINPLFCTRKLVDENDHITRNDCTEDDLKANSG